MITVYEVWLCGPTDCFWHATFAESARATEWGEANQQPEGYIIKERVIPDPDTSH